jgi:glutamate formiminotransferase / 5-formyltetrahydrofolate cyclo-ligase
MAWLECVPNVSEGRDPRVLDRLTARLTAAAGVRLLDVHRDADHHRSVFTLVGDGPALTAAILALCEEALDTIDLRHHRGAHPRIGAVDVVPFVPLGRATMDDAVAAARATGRAIAERFGIPVLLYEEAATAPHRQRLEQVRRGRFEGLTDKLRTAGWTPDFGPAAPHPTFGAIAIGARRLLVAYNINLATDRLEVGTAVAAAVRASSGGLPHVKAMALPLPARGLIQVSMNLTNVDVTPMAVVFDAVSREAARHGVAVAESEIVGLVPAAALADVAARALRVAGWSPDRILDTRLLPD